MDIVRHVVSKSKRHPFSNGLTRRHTASLHCYLQRSDTARWSRRVRPWTWWTVDPGTPRRRRRRRPPTEPSGPALPGATLRKENIPTCIQTPALVIFADVKPEWNSCSPVSLEDAHNQLPVKLSNLQLYHRSEFSRPSHSHQDFKERLDTKHTAGYVDLMK